MADYIKALIFPFAGRENTKNFVIGAIINIFWFLLIPLFFVWGYLVKVIQHTLQEKDEMPSWSKPLELLKHGLSAFFIMAAYNILPLAITLLALNSIGDLSTTVITPELMSSVPVYATGLIVFSSVLMLIAWFFLPMALITYAATEDIKQAFNFPELFARLRKRLFGYLTTYVITITAFLLALLVLIVPFVQLVSGIITFYAFIFIVHNFSQIYVEAENL